MSLPAKISGDEEVIFGGGPHALVYAATRVACGHPPPVVLEQRSQLGGMFVPLANFRMNSARGASVESVRSPGVTRIPSRSPSDDLNYLLNAPYQVNSTSGMVEYPYSLDFWKTVARGLPVVARCYTSANAMFESDGSVYSPGGTTYLGTPKRVIFAGGLVERTDMPTGPAIMSGYRFMKKPVRELEGLKIAVVGSGDTAAQIVEWMFGGGVTAPSTPPTLVHWYGGEAMPTTKERWVKEYHARFAGTVGRHLPQDGGVDNAILRPYAQRAEVASLGCAAMVNRQTYDMAIMATGFVPAPCPVMMRSTARVSGLPVARFVDDGSGNPKVFTIGTAANLGSRYQPYKSRFLATSAALFVTLPETAALAGSLS